MQLATVISVAFSIISSAVAATEDTVPNYFLIRHAEKTKNGILSTQGLKRAQCLISVFGKGSKYNIQHIMTQTPYPGDTELDHETQRPYNTTLPLAESLGVTIDHPCNFTDTSCAGKAAVSYTGPGNVLITWEHDHLPAVAEAIGAKNVPKYPSSHYDLIYTLAIPYTNVNISSEDCPQDYTTAPVGTTGVASTTAPAGATTKASAAVQLHAFACSVSVAAAAVTISALLLL